jgi:hypothetical protein
MITDLERILYKTATTTSTYYTEIFIVGLGKTTKELSLNSQDPGLKSNQHLRNTN